MASDLKIEMSRKTGIFGLQVWEVICICVAIFVIVILSFSIYLSSRKKKSSNRVQLPVSQIPAVSKEIKEVFQIEQVSTDEFAPRDGGVLLTIHDKSNENDSDKVLVHVGMAKKNKNGNGNAGGDKASSHGGSFHRHEKELYGDQEECSSAGRATSAHITAPSPLNGLPEFSQLGWGHWFTLRDLELATNRFSKDNVLGEGGYGVVYRGNLVNGSPVAVKKILNNLGQAEKEFRVEVEAIGHVRHKNLVRLLGYCIEGTHRMLVYEYVNNGNLEQWLHGAMRHHGYLTWEARIKVLLGTAKALAYLHDAIEPKVVHRDIKSSNILIDDDFNAKVSDFGLAKLLGAGKSHVTTRVNLVDWLKMMVGSRRSEEVVDPNIERRPSTRSLKRALLTALRCVDPDSEKRPKMGQVVRMLESEEYPIPREDRRQRRAQGGNSIETESQKENSDSDCPLAAAGDSTRRS
ncbi:Probable receptor-like protein kinase At5g18500 [Linum perenne]